MDAMEGKFNFSIEALLKTESPRVELSSSSSSTLDKPATQDGTPSASASARVEPSGGPSTPVPPSQGHESSGDLHSSSSSTANSKFFTRRRMYKFRLFLQRGSI